MAVECHRYSGRLKKQIVSSFFLNLVSPFLYGTRRVTLTRTQKLRDEQQQWELIYCNEEEITLLYSLKSSIYINPAYQQRKALQTIIFSSISQSQWSCLAMYHRSLHVLISISNRVMKTILSSKESGEGDLHDYGTNSVYK